MKTGILTAIVLAGLGVLATAQVDVSRTRMHADPAGGLDPTVGDAGIPMCFGDGTGAKCGGVIPGAPGRGCENSLNTGGAILNGHGIPKISADTLEFDVAGLPFSTTALYLQSNKLANGGAGYTFGDGVMCLGGSVKLIATVRTTDGYTTYPVKGQAPLSIVGKVSMAEPTQYYQVMYRDVHALLHRQEFNLTNGWETVWAP